MFEKFKNLVFYNKFKNNFVGTYLYYLMNNITHVFLQHLISDL